MNLIASYILEVIHSYKNLTNESLLNNKKNKLKIIAI